MSSSSREVNTVVIEMEPGWVYVKIADPTPEPGRIEFFLRRTIDDWFAVRLAFVIDKAEAITNHGEMLGIHVWYHEEPGRPQDDERPDNPVSTFSFEVHRLISQQFSREYIEAVVDDALRILPSYQHCQNTLVVINPRRVVVILDNQARRGAVLPVSLLEQVVDGAMREKMETWLTDPPASFYVMHIAGNWFDSWDEES